jgi:hypothetical protein
VNPNVRAKMEWEGEKPVHTEKKSLGNRWKWEARNFFLFFQISNRFKTFFSFSFTYGFVNGKKATTR